ncbi:hypothetical protein 0305phi8-36p073 [Bacillus phage 0305phi8-36]|uniref:hypothetical protein n=1 Tax=Bacillus phage 0305phi8-36 TaxID=458639 RepID=UPI00015A1FA5|nr:hypothetical protein ST0305phi8-36p073 [Bacillus phage 0305phi8-36]ABS83633.1 hypothetical protein 0305phi8-36p073 [Bacillus phage 0305phi8-36]
MDAKNTERSFISRKQRQQNMNDILNSINPDKHNFNTVLMGFTDIIQSTFFNHVDSMCRTEEEKITLRNRINGTVNAVMETLNECSLTNPEDMVVLSTIMVEAINKSLYRQQEEGELPVNHTVLQSRSHEM